MDTGAPLKRNYARKITKTKLLENKLIGVRETHRLVFTVQSETWNMGKVLKKIG
jgi:hypothetical protein